MRKYFKVLTGLTLLTFMAGCAESVDPVPEPAVGEWKEVENPDAETLDEFGRAMGLEGETLAVGAPGAEAHMGEVKLYDLDGDDWVYDETLTLDSASRFGETIAFDGRTLVVASGENHGSVHVYKPEGDSWRLEQTLTHPTLDDLTDYGDALAVKGNLLVVGAPLADKDDSQSGQVLIYERTSEGWVLATTLEGEQSDGGFGSSVAIGDEYLAVGAPKTVNGGTATVYSLDDWRQVMVFEGADNGSRLGTALDWDRNVLAVSSPGNGGEGAPVGMVDIVDASKNWESIGQVQPLETSGLQRFGESIALDNGALAVGAPSFYKGDSPVGAVYLFRDNRVERFENDGMRWQQVAFYMSERKAGDQLGDTVTLDNQHLLVGSPGEQLDFKTVGNVEYLHFAWTAEPA